MARPFCKRYRYRFGDIDHAGIAYYPSLLHYFHCCFEDWWADALGKPYPQVMREERFGLPAVNLQVDFFSPIRYGDEPEISLGVLAVGNTSVQLGTWMTLAGKERPACRARITTVAVHLDTMAKRPIPPEWRARFEACRLDGGDFPM
jgi:4-hydroxybenzoyl-CoA thioesterase